MTVTIEDVLTRALAETQERCDRLAEQLAAAREELAIHKQWVALDEDDDAVLVVGDVDHPPGSWVAVFRWREHAEAFAELARSQALEDAPSNAAVLEGVVSAGTVHMWNMFEPAKHPHKEDKS